MNRRKLPSRFRPTGLKHKKLVPGIDLPAWFVDDIKSVDPNFYFVFHPYRVMYEDIMNNYEGKLDDPRFAINEKYGEEVWGWVLTDPHKNPIPEARWHCWRLCDTGWAHIFEVKYLDPIYLRTIVNRLGIQKVLTEKYGIKAYVKYLREEREAIQESDINEKNNQFIDIQKENKWLLDKAMDNFTQGRIAPTRPQKEIITSYSNQTNKSKIVRDITDREGGLYVPDSEDN